MYTWIHGLVFCAIGGFASRLLGLAERNPNLGFGILLLFVVLEVGFVMAAFVLAEPLLHKLAWQAILVGNLLAAAAMAGYFRRRHPNLAIAP
jgi:O-antigen/teichoic acid export membrane protein